MFCLDFSLDRRPFSIEINRVQSETRATQSEIHSISTQQSFSRVRKSEVEDAKRTAAEASRYLEEQSKDPRLTSIPNQVKDNEAKIVGIQQKIDEENETLSELRKHAEKQNTISTLQLEVDMENKKLEESIVDSAYMFRKFNLTFGPTDLKSLEALAQHTKDKRNFSSDNLKAANDELAQKHRRLTEKKTKVEHNTDTLARLRNRLASFHTGCQQITSVIEEIRNYEAGKSGRPVTLPDIQPKELLQHLDEKLREVEAENLNSPELVAQIIKKLKKMVRFLSRVSSQFVFEICDVTHPVFGLTGTDSPIPRASLGMQTEAWLE